MCPDFSSLSGVQAGRTPLHLAAVSGNTGAVVLLCGVGADVNALDASGVPPLCKAAAGKGLGLSKVNCY